MPLLHKKMIAALSIFATLWLNVNCFRPSKLSCCKHSQRTSVKLNNIVDVGSLETSEDLIVTLPKIMARGLLTGILDISNAKDYLLITVSSFADLTSPITAERDPFINSPSKMYEQLTTRWGMGHNLAVTLIDHYGGHIYDIVSQLEYLNRQGEGFVTVSQAQTDDVQRCLDFDGDKKRMRELLTQIAKKGFALLSKGQDREAEAISKYNVGGSVQLQGATVIGLPFDVCGKHRIGLIPSKQSIRLIIAEVLHMNPEDLADNARADSTRVDEDLEIIEEQLTRLAMKVDDVESDINQK